MPSRLLPPPPAIPAIPLKCGVQPCPRLTKGPLSPGAGARPRVHGPQLLDAMSPHCSPQSPRTGSTYVPIISGPPRTQRVPGMHQATQSKSPAQTRATSTCPRHAQVLGPQVSVCMSPPRAAAPLPGPRCSLHLRLLGCSCVFRVPPRSSLGQGRARLAQRHTRARPRAWVPEGAHCTADRCTDEHRDRHTARAAAWGRQRQQPREFCSPSGMG